MSIAKLVADSPPRIRCAIVAYQAALNAGNGWPAAVKAAIAAVDWHDAHPRCPDAAHCSRHGCAEPAVCKFRESRP